MELTIGPDEAEVLASAIHSYLTDLRMEIADTDRMAMRDELKQQEKVLTDLLARLAARAVTR